MRPPYRRIHAVADDGARPRIEHLHDVARRAIVSLLQVLERINESWRRTSGAVQGFREPARRFAAAPTEKDPHRRARRWSGAFGLGSARHAHLAHADTELISSAPRPAHRRTAHRQRRADRTGLRRPHHGGRRSGPGPGAVRRAALPASRAGWLPARGPVGPIPSRRHRRPASVVHGRHPVDHESVRC
ncbi:DUF2397 family protein [Streptomyces antibioticus]|uniref:DUF2397 family protein n=1 Tax=Streptomyces antibioticus TaxID=1890 RepID=UPI003D75A055